MNKPPTPPGVKDTAAEKDRLDAEWKSEWEDYKARKYGYGAYGYSSSYYSTPGTWRSYYAYPVDSSYSYSTPAAYTYPSYSYSYPNYNYSYSSGRTCGPFGCY
jgi:hypothetical protein